MSEVGLTVKCSNADCRVTQFKALCCPCQKVQYCSKECQKSDWKKGHKAVCSTKKDTAGAGTGAVVAVAPAAGTTMSAPARPAASSTLTLQEVEVRLHQIKVITQTAFRNGDLAQGMKLANESLQLASLFPEPRSSIEVSTTCLRLASIYAQTGNAAAAMSMCDQCLERATKWCAAVEPGPHQNAAKEILMAGNGTKSHLMLTSGKLQEAHDTAARAGVLAKELYSADDARQYRPIRALAFVKDRQGKEAEAEGLFLQGYKLLLAQNKPLDPEFNQALEELISFVMKQQKDGKPREGADTKAVVYAEAHVAALETLSMTTVTAPGTEAKSADDRKRDELILGDAYARLASLRFRSTPAASEVLMTKTLAIREKNIGAESQGVAITLVALSEMKEAQGKFGPETENLLLRALAAFEKLEKKGSEHCVRIQAKLERLKALREGRTPPPEENSMFEEVEENLRGGGGKKVPGSTQRTSAAGKGKRVAPTPPKFDADDGKGRFEVAVQMLQAEYFEEACPIGAWAGGVPALNRPYIRITLASTQPHHCKTNAPSPSSSSDPPMQPYRPTRYC